MKLGKNLSENDTIQKKALALSDVFFEMEGRRPRVLVGTFSDNSGKDLNKIANTLSDLGFDVDISPHSQSAEGFARNALENDVDTLLVFKGLSHSQKRMIDLENFLDRQHAEILLLAMGDVSKWNHLEEDSFQTWIILNLNTNSSEVGLLILKELLNRTN